MKLDAKTHILIDVRSAEEFEICHLKNSINIPLNDINNDEKINFIKNKIEEMQKQYDKTTCKCII